jgi:glycosyltransferase involved in cell wall biosynthesis
MASAAGPAPDQAPPPLSVVLCSHARPHYLKACLAGLSTQTRRSFEILVVDSASPPGAASEIAALAAEAGARLLRCPAPGLSRARNRGLEAARGAWVAYLDDDAVPEPGWAEALLARIAALPREAAALGGRILPAWEAPLPPWWPRGLIGVLTIVEWEGFGEVGRSLPPEVEIYGANMAFAADALRAVGGFPEALGRIGDRLLSGEEVEVVARLRAAGRPPG